MSKTGVLHGKNIALIGCGDIGCRLAKSLLEQEARVFGFRRSIEKLPADIIGHRIDVEKPESLVMLGTLDFDYVVITLSPTEMSDESYRRIYVEGLAHILSRLNRAPLRKLFWVSSTSVYGQNDGSEINEDSPATPIRFSGKRQLEAEQLLTSLQDKACTVRFAGIYREGKHRLVELLKAGKLSGNVTNDYITNRIHIEDCAGILHYLIEQDAKGKKIERCYLGVDSAPVLYSELIQWLSMMAKLPLSEDGEEQTPRVGSKRCSNLRLLQSGYQFKYPTYKEGFAGLLQSY